jgi:hypothetical protein
MSIVIVPPCVSSITLSTSGVLAPTANLITTTQAEMQSLCSPYTEQGSTPIIDDANISTGTINMRFPSVVTSITVNGNVYAVTAGVASAVAAADFNDLVRMSASRQSLFIMAVG